MKENYTFKKGDRVILVGGYSASPSNPRWDSVYRCAGKYLGGGRVEWNNGISNNSYGTDTDSHILALLSKEEEKEATKTTYKPDQGLCVVTGKMSEILDRYKGASVGHCNMSLAGYEKFRTGKKKWSNKPIKGKEKGLIISDRTFGVELECFAGSREEKDIGDFLINPNYIPETDGSLEGSYCREYKSPILQNKAGEDSLMETCAMLQRVGFRTNSSCGTHVHIGVPEAKEPKIDINMQERLKNLLLFYTVFDPCIYFLLPPSRRENRFCYPMKHMYSNSHISKLKADKRFDFFWYATTDEDRIRELKGMNRHGEQRIDRYCGINFNSLSLRGTLEIRYHQGTLDAPKLLTWIDFHTGIVDYVLNGSITEEQIESMKSIKDEREMLVTLLDLIKSCINKKTFKAILERYDTVNSPSYKDPIVQVEDEDDWDEEDEEYDNDEGDNDDEWL